jgi:hypothetical protein
MPHVYSGGHDRRIWKSRHIDTQTETYRASDLDLVYYLLLDYTGRDAIDLTNVTINRMCRKSYRIIIGTLGPE